MSTSQVVPFTTSAPGLNAFSALMGGFTQPAVNATVDVVIRLGQWAVKGQSIYIENGGLYRVERKILNPDGSITATIRNLGDPANASPGTSVPIGDCSPAGTTGPTGPAGTTTTGGVGIGALGSGGFLRTIKGAVGAIGLGLHIGAWGSAIADSGGGSFVWSSTSTAADDGISCYRPDGAGVGPSDPGRWFRIWSGAVQVDWAGAVGDGLRDTSTTGTDDRAAIQAAITFAGGYGHRLLFDPKKVYICDGDLDVSYKGLVLDGQGTWTFSHGAWIKFRGAHDDRLIKVDSTVGLQVRGLILTAAGVTRTVLDAAHTHADQATRLAAGWTVLGTTVDQTDTGERWRLVALPSTSASNWVRASYALIGIRQTNWGGIGGAGGGDSLGIVIENCLLTGPASYIMHAGIQVAQTDCSKIVNCNISYFKYGITSNDQYWGGGAGICIDVDTCTFNAIQTRSIYQPFSNWTIRNNSFEVRADSSVDGVEVATNAGGQSSNIVCIGNIHADGTASGGSCYRFFNAIGVTLIGNQGFSVAGGTFCYLASCYGVESHGNFLFGMTKSYDIEATGSPCGAMKLGPDYSNLPPTGTNYRCSLVLTLDTGTLSVGGMSWGGSNTFTGYNGVAIGSGHTVAGQGLAVGSNNTAPASGASFGANGMGLDACDITLGGGTNTGISGGSQQRRNILSSNAVAGGGATTSLKKADATTLISLTDNRLYTFEYTVTVGKNSVAAAFQTKRRAQVKRLSGGATTVISDVEVWKDDLGTTGITVAAVASSSKIDVQVTNPTANTLYAVCHYELQGTYSP